MKSLPWCLVVSLSGWPVSSPLAALSAPEDQVVCHYTYGGETRQLAAPPTSSPYAVKGIQVGSYFQLRVVFQNEPADIASIKVYAYADREEGPVPIHQATYPYPPPRTTTAFGFSGLQAVYEPTRDGELQYWCELVPAAHSAWSTP